MSMIFLSSVMLDEIWILCSLVIPSVLLSRPKKPSRKCCEVINRNGSVLEKDEKEILIISVELQHTETACILRCISKIKFCHSKDWGTRASTTGKGRTTMGSWWRYKVWRVCCCWRGLGTPMGLGCLPAPSTSRGSSASTGDFPHPATGNVSQGAQLCNSLQQLLSRASTSSAPAHSCQWCLITKMSSWQTSSYS